MAVTTQTFACNFDQELADFGPDLSSVPEDHQEAVIAALRRAWEREARTFAMAFYVYGGDAISYVAEPTNDLARWTQDGTDRDISEATSALWQSFPCAICEHGAIVDGNLVAQW